MKCVGAFILFVVFLLVHQGWAYEPPDQAVLIVTLPKSGTVFLVDSCKKNLSRFGYVHRQISPKRFHDDYVNERRLARFAGTHFFSLAHIDASVDNIAILQKHTPKVVLHLRDPRQAFLSWLHHVEKVGTSHYFLWSSDICPPPEYYSWSMDSKIDWQIEHYLPACVRWIEEWCEVIDRGELDVFVTRFEDMVVDTPLFLERIFAFYNIQLPGEVVYAPFRKGQLHQREGKTNEWEQVLTEQQKQRVHEIVPVELLARFGWN